MSKFNLSLRSDHSVSKDRLGRANTLANARIRIVRGRGYLMFRIPYDEALSVGTLRELVQDGWKEYSSHCLMKELRL